MPQVPVKTEAMPLKLVQTPVPSTLKSYDVDPKPVYIQGLGNVTATKGAAVADVTAPNATDAASTQTLANANKVTINALLASLRAAGIIA